jgi:hypothetical protein
MKPSENSSGEKRIRLTKVKQCSFCRAGLRDRWTASIDAASGSIKHTFHFPGSTMQKFLFPLYLNTPFLFTHMKVEIGHKIKEVFDASNMKLTDFADKLGTVRQNVYRIFKKRHLDTGLLLKISEVLNHNFFMYYVQSQAKTENTEQDQLKLARKEIDYLRKIIKLMEEKTELARQLEKDDIIR